VSTHKQRYRPNCRYFNFVCQPNGKYSLECSRDRDRCKDGFCTAGLHLNPTRQTAGPGRQGVNE